MYCQLVERLTDILSLRREQIDTVSVETHCEAALMAECLRDGDVLSAQYHRRRYEHLHELLDIIFGV